MSVTITFRVRADAAKLEEMAAGEGGPLLKQLRELAIEAGCTRHRFFGDDQEVMVLDEWESEEAYRGFLQAHPEIGEAMRAMGVTDQPEIRVWRALATNDEIG